MFYRLLQFPLVYNLRFLVTGNQKEIRHFIMESYSKYNCNTVVDIGCGTGDFSSLFPVATYLGIDINARYIQYARKKYPHTYIIDDATKYSFKKRYDAGLFISTLHHFSDGDVHTLFSHLKKIIKKVIIIVDLNPETTLIKKMLINLDRGSNVRTTKQKQKLLSRYGTIVSITHFSAKLASQSGIILSLNN